LVIFWSFANDNHIFVVFNQLKDVQNPHFTILRTTTTQQKEGYTFNKKKILAQGR
jgi:hypothetical protein